MSKNYESGIDFMITTYGGNSLYTIDLALLSIQKFINNTPYTIYIINNYEDNKNLYKEKLLNAIKNIDKTHIQIIDGVNQSDKNVTTTTRIDGTTKAWPSTYGIQAYQIGTKIGNREYMCYMDPDSVILCEWTDKILPKLDKYFLISALYEDGTAFKNCQSSFDKHWEKMENEGGQLTKIDYKNLDKNNGMAWLHWLILKRENLDKNNLIPNLDWRDSGGNLTLFCIENQIPFLAPIRNTDESILYDSKDKGFMRSEYKTKVKGALTYLGDNLFYHHIMSINRQPYENIEIQRKKWEKLLNES